MKAPIVSLFIRAIGFLFSAGQTVILARVLGAEDLGVYAAILAVVTILATPTSLGLSGFLTRELAITKSSNNPELARGLVKSTNFLLWIYFACSMAILAMLSYIGVFPKREIIYIILAGMMVFLLGTDQLRAGAMRGLGSALLSQLPEVVIRPGIFLIIVMCLALFFDSIDVKITLVAFIAGAITATIFGQVALFRQLKGYSPVAKAGVKVAARSSVGLIFLGALGTLQVNIDIMILSYFGLHVEAGLYRVALLGTVALLFVYDALSAIAVRDLAASMANKSQDITLKVSDRLTSLGLGTAIIITVIYIIFGNFAIGLIFGAAFTDANYVLIILALGHTISIACGPSVEIIRLLSSQKTGVTINAISIFLSVSISISLINWNPLLAVAIGSAIGNIFRRSVLSIHVSRQLQADISILGAIFRKTIQLRSS